MDNLSNLSAIDNPAAKKQPRPAQRSAEASSRCFDIGAYGVYK
jgi:hypothetical protein